MFLGGRESSKILQTATEKVPANSMCSLTYAILGIPVTRRHVCAGGDRDKGICFVSIISIIFKSNVPFYSQ